MATSRASQGRAFEAFDAWSQKSSKYDPTATLARWNHYKTSPPDELGMGSLIHWAREAAPGWRKPSDLMNNAKMLGGEAKANGQGAGTDSGSASDKRVPLLDPWDAYIVPPFPFYVLPRAVQTYIETHSVVVGCDPSALAMTCLANFSAAIDHRFALKMMRNGNWWSNPRLWVLLVGDPSRKKTPIMKVAFSELEACQNALRDGYEQDLAAFKESKDAAAGEPAKPRASSPWIPLSRSSATSSAARSARESWSGATRSPDGSVAWKSIVGAPPRGPQIALFGFRRMTAVHT
jgi:hypothetical protein